MGEIADAIRRARAAATGGRREAGEPGPSGPQHPAPEPAHRVREVPRPAAERRLERLVPQSPAIVLDEGPTAEACRHVALRLRAELEARSARSVAIVSAVRGEGKTTVACNLAIALATLSQGREVALVDLDLRRSSIAAYLSLPRHAAGIEQVLQGGAELEDVCLAVEKPALDLYPAAAPQRAAHELMVLPRFGETIEALERRYATVVVDTPPTLFVPDARLILRHVAVCVPVGRTGQSRVRQLRQLAEHLPRQQVLGPVLNDTRRSQIDYGGYGYYGEESEDGSRRSRRRRETGSG